jgi:hypothetical protein
MSLIGIRNIIAPFQNRIQIVTLVIVTVLVGVIRLVTTSGPAAQRIDSGSRGQYEESTFGDAQSTNDQIDGLIGGGMRGAPAARRPTQQRKPDFDLDDVLSAKEPRKAPVKPAPSRGQEAGGFDEVRKQLGL